MTFSVQTVLQGKLFTSLILPLSGKKIISHVNKESEKEIVRRKEN